MACNCTNCSNSSCNCNCNNCNSCYSCGFVCGVNATTCTSCGCTDPCTTTCTCTCNDTGCEIQLDSKCLIYKGTSLTCIGKESGATGEAIFQAIDAIICDLDPATQITYVVEGCASEIDVTTAVVGTTTTFTVCLDSVITDAIADLQTDIAVIQAAISTLPITLSTTSPEITLVENSDNNWSIDWASPTSDNFDGIIEQNPTANSQTGPGAFVLASFNNDYITNQDLTTGDEVRFSFEGSANITGDPPLQLGGLTFEVYEDNTAITKASFGDASFGQNLYGFTITGTLRVMNVNLTHLTANMKYNLGALGSFSQTILDKTIIRKAINNLDYNDLTLRVLCSSQTASTFTVSSIMVEVRKAI